MALDSRSKYDCSPRFSGSGIIICGGLSLLSSALVPYRFVAAKTIDVPKKYWEQSVFTLQPKSDVQLTSGVISKSKKITLARKLTTMEILVAKSFVMLFA